MIYKAFRRPVRNRFRWCQPAGRLLAVLLGLLVAVAHATPVRAHEVLPAITDFHANDRVSGANRYALLIRLNAEALLAGIGAEHEDTDDSPQARTYNALHELQPEVLKQRLEAFGPELVEALDIRFDGERTRPDLVSIEVPEVGNTAEVRLTRLRLEGAFAEGIETFQWAWPQRFGASVIRMNPPGAERGEGYAAYLGAGEVSEVIPVGFTAVRPIGQIITEYIRIGFDHIVPRGLDHILFVIGLFLLSSRWKPLLWQVTAFTVAHTITLALAVLGYVTVSPAIVEPLIAASIVYVAVENLFTSQLNPWRPLIVFCFGLLHGLGFADVLGEIGLSATHFVAGLIAFNVGVELGQLAVIALCYFAIGIWFAGRPWYRRYLTNPLSLLVALVGAWWFYERVFL